MILGLASADVANKNQFATAMSFYNLSRLGIVKEALHNLYPCQQRLFGVVTIESRKQNVAIGLFQDKPSWLILIKKIGHDETSR